MGLFQEETRTTLLRKRVKRVEVATRTTAAPMTTRTRLKTSTLMLVLTTDQVHARIAALMTSRRRPLNKTATAIPLVSGGRPLPRPANMETAALIQVTTREKEKLRKAALMTSRPRLLKKEKTTITGSHHLPRHLHPRPAKTDEIAALRLTITMLMILYLRIVFILEIIVHALAVLVIELHSKKVI